LGETSDSIAGPSVRKPEIVLHIRPATTSVACACSAASVSTNDSVETGESRRNLTDESFWMPDRVKDVGGQGPCSSLLVVLEDLFLHPSHPICRGRKVVEGSVEWECLSARPGARGLKV
jgi:hypothetical protein